MRKKPYERDTNKFYSPKIHKVSVTIEGKPNQLYAQGVQRDNNANEVQAQLQLHDLSVGEYLVNKYALWLDFRMIDKNVLHRTGRRIENASEGITLQIEKKAETQLKN